MSRYIDADALLSKLPEDLPYKASVKRVLIQAPTADVVEVRHGEWIRKDFKPCGHDYICSLCGYAVPQAYKHCPECVAKMDGERIV